MRIIRNEMDFYMKPILNIKPMFKLSALTLLSAVIAVGCSQTPNTEAKITTHEMTASSATPSNSAKVVEVHAVSAAGIGQKIGAIQLQDSPQGLVIQTQLTQLTTGEHGFHIHEKGSCEPAEKEGKMTAALAAGGHFNPQKAPNHGTPNTGHLGDLPVLTVDAQGNANTTSVAPRLKLADVEGLAIMVHAGGDNYSDAPKPLGGGGDRVACGII